MLPQLAQEDDGFEIRSIADSFDEDDEEVARKDHERAVPPTGGASTTMMDSMASEPPPARKPSPAPALQNSSQVPPPIGAPPQSRMSLDGETIFAVGDEGGEWSDGEDSDDERRKLTSK